jgi:hypothetical protein
MRDNTDRRSVIAGRHDLSNQIESILVTSSLFIACRRIPGIDNYKVGSELSDDC